MTIYLRTALLLLAIGLLAAGISFFTISFAQTAPAPQFFVSWQAHTYAPPFYTGKRLATNNSTVTATFELLTGGRSADLSQQTIRWYLNNELYRSGDGLKTITFNIDPLTKNDYTVRITLPRYRNGDDLDHLFTIPIVPPEVVIDAPYPEGKIPAGTNLLRALLYFFNTTNPARDIDIAWTVNGERTQTSALTPDILEMQIPLQIDGGTTLTVSTDVHHRQNSFEFASTQRVFSVK